MLFYFSKTKSALRCLDSIGIIQRLEWRAVKIYCDRIQIRWYVALVWGCVLWNKYQIDSQSLLCSFLSFPASISPLLTAILTHNYRNHRSSHRRARNSPKLFTLHKLSTVKSGSFLDEFVPWEFMPEIDYSDPPSIQCNSESHGAIVLKRLFLCYSVVYGSIAKDTLFHSRQNILMAGLENTYFACDVSKCIVSRPTFTHKNILFPSVICFSIPSFK